MNGSPRFATRIIAISPSSRGFGFVALEGYWLLDWGFRSTRGKKETQTVEGLRVLIDRYAPSILVLEDSSPTKSRRCKRIHQLIQRLTSAAIDRDVAVYHCSPEIRKQIFNPLGAHTKREIALTLVEYFPELKATLPKKRRPWTSEDFRMSIFDALMLAWGYFNATD